MIFTALMLTKRQVFVQQGFNSSLTLHSVDATVKGCSLAIKGCG